MPSLFYFRLSAGIVTLFTAFQVAAIDIYFAADQPPINNIPPEAPLCYKFNVSNLEEQIAKLKRKYGSALYDDYIRTNPDGSRYILAKRTDALGNKVLLYYSDNPIQCSKFQQSRQPLAKEMDKAGHTSNEVLIAKKNQKELSDFAFVNDGQIYVVEKKGTTPRRVAEGEAPDWSPREPMLAFQGHNGGIFLVDLRTGKQRNIHKTGVGPLWAPDGVHIAFRDGDHLHIAAITTGRLTSLDSISPDSCGPNWLPDSKTILYINDKSGIPEIRKIPADGGNAVVIGNGYLVGFSPDKNNAVIAVHPSRRELALAMLDIQTKQMRIVFQDTMNSDNDIIGCPLWSPRGDRLAVEIKKHGDKITDDIFVFEVPSFTIHRVFRTGAIAQIDEMDTKTIDVFWEIGSMAWSPDGDVILASLIEPRKVVSGAQLKPGEIGFVYLTEREIKPPEVSGKVLDVDHLTYINVETRQISGSLMQSGHAPAFRGGTKVLWRY